MALSRRFPRCRRARLKFDLLESREVPAGIVDVTLANGVLTLIGDDLSNTIIVAPGAGAGPHVKLTPDPDTDVGAGPGVEVVLQGAVNSLRCKMNGGNDNITLTATIDAGSDGIADLILTGAVAFDMGDGDNTLTVDSLGTTALGDLSVVGGQGFDRVVLTAREAGSGMATGRRSHKPLLMNLGDGGFDVDMNGFVVTNGGLSFTAGHGGGGGGGGLADGTFDAVNVTIDGAFTSNTGTGLCSFSFGATQMGSMAMGSGGGAGRLAVTLADITGTPNSGSHVKGDLKISSAAEIALHVLHSAVDKSVKVQKKWLPANFRMLSMIEVSDSTIGGDLLVTDAGSSCTTQVQMTQAHVDGGVKFASTGANSAAFLALQNVSSGPISVQATGKGNSAAIVNVGGDCSAGAFSVKATNFAVVDVLGVLSLGLGGIANETGDITVSSRGMVAHIGVDGVAADLKAHNVGVTGPGVAEVRMMNQASLHVRGNLSVASEQSALVSDPVRNGLVDVAGKVSVKGTDQALIQSGNSWSSGPVSVSSRMGAAMCVFDPLVLDLDGDLTVQGAFLTDVTVAPKSPGKLIGSVSSKGGVGNDQVTLQDVDGLKDVLLDLGDGNNTATLRRTLVLPHVLEVSGSLRVSAGAGFDAYVLKDILISGYSTLNTGNGKDTLTVDGECTFQQKVKIDAGGGDDQILIGLLLNATGPVTFAVPVAISAGAGNDLLKLGVTNDPTIPDDDNSRVVFAAGIDKVDGGTGHNVFIPNDGDFNGLDITEMASWSSS